MADPAGATFIDIPKVFTDNQYAKEKLAFVKDKIVLDFWNKEMAQTSDYHKSEVLGWFVSQQAFLLPRPYRSHYLLAPLDIHFVLHLQSKDNLQVSQKKKLQSRLKLT